jgi:thiol-disulfide isomerase/thioredoxin
MEIRVFLTLITLLLLAACGRTEQPSGEAGSGPESPNAPEGRPEDDVAAALGQGAAGGEDAGTPSFAGRVAAPEFPEGLDWLNVDRPLTLADLRGKIVLLDFWTYGCINCMHIIPDLLRLEEKYAEELVVIGVHSAKFENEADTDNIRQIILRYELTHPVVNDNRFEIWNTYGARAWPTLVLIDPDGMVLGYHSGEGIYAPFDAAIGGMLREFDALGKIDRTPIAMKLEQDQMLASPLRFPGKVLADAEGKRLFVADSNHNRLVVTDLEGYVLEVIGDGQARLRDGDFETASFSRPQGMTLADADTLYVADTKNHAIRRVDLAAGTVETVAGNGWQVYNPHGAGNGPEVPLNSPWDVLYHDGTVYIAMAGQHQLWFYDVASGQVGRYAGSGREELRDGPLGLAGLNQPSGLATDGLRLYVADSEASAIRAADLEPAGRLTTIVGTGLFDFGDVDGTGNEVRLQHPLGLVYHNGLLYVADTYNSKIKLVDPQTRESQSYLGGPSSGWRDGPDPLFYEPGGLSLADNKLYVADTNNHAIRVVDLDGNTVETLVLIDMEGLLTRQAPGSAYSGKVEALDPQLVAPGEGSVQLEVAIPPGYKVNDLAPFSMDWTAAGTAVTFRPEQANLRLLEPEFPLRFPATFSEGEGELTGELVIYYCQEEAQSLCFIERVRVTAPFSVAAGGQPDLRVGHDIEVPPG